MEIYKHNYMVKLFKILANANRVRVLELLLSAQTPLTVNEIAYELKVDQGNLSNHLKLMRKDGVLKAKQVSTKMYYSVKDGKVAEVMRAAGLAQT